MRSKSLLPLVFVAGCVSAPPQALARPTAPASSATAQVIKATNTTAITTPTAPEMEHCLDRPGQVVHSELNDPALPRSLPYSLYLPPCYEEDSHSTYPTIYLLHGLARTDRQWMDLGAAEAADEIIASEGARPFLMVMPWERKGLDFETAIVDGLMPHMEAELGASSNPQLRAIGGISRGAGWAFRIGMRHPGLVSAIGMHSPVILPPDTLRLPRWMEALDSQPRLWIDMGDRDTLRFDLAEFIELLDANAVAYEWMTYPGEHTAKYWSAHLGEYLEWYVRDWLAEN